MRDECLLLLLPTHCWMLRAAAKPLPSRLHFCGHGLAWLRQTQTNNALPGKIWKAPSLNFLWISESPLVVVVQRFSARTEVHCRVSESIIRSTFYLARFLQGEIYQTAERRRIVQLDVLLYRETPKPGLCFQIHTAVSIQKAPLIGRI